MESEAYEEQSVHYYIPPPAERREFLYYPVSAGYFVCKPNYHVQRNSFYSYLLIVMREGSLDYQTMHARGTAHAGQVLLLDCHSPHSYGAQGRCAFSFMHFDGAQSREICAEIERACGLLFATPQIDELDRALRGFMRALEEKRRIDELETSAMLYGILMRLLQASGEAERGTGGNAVVDRAVRYIQEHLSGPLPVASVAEYCGYSASRFTGVFTRETGLSPHRFLVKSRVERAQQLLATTQLSVQEIAFQTGFGSASHFCYAFRRETGVSAQAYREKQTRA